MGLGLLIGFIIGAGVGAAVVFWQQQSSQRARHGAGHQRLAQLEQTHEQRLRAVTEQLKAEYRQQLADKIERYQDEQIQKFEALDAEYQARLAVLEQAYQGASNSAGSPITTPAKASVRGSEMSPLPDPWMPVPPEVTSPTVEPVSAPIQPSRQSTQSSPASGVRLALSDLVTQAQSSDPNLRRETAEILGEVVVQGAKPDAIKAVPLLGKLTKDPEPDVRLAAVRSLSQMSSARVVPLLRQALRDIDGEVVAAASAALARFKGTKAQPQLRKRRPKNR